MNYEKEPPRNRNSSGQGHGAPHKDPKSFGRDLSSKAAEETIKETSSSE
jgi:hypothetical protein